jgi:hypothetical protein
MTLHTVLLGLLAALAFFVVTTGAVMVLLLKLPVDYFSRPRRQAGADRHPAWTWTLWLAKNLAGVLTVLVGFVLALPGVPGPGLVLILIGVALLDFPGKRNLERKLLGRPHVRRHINSFRARFGKPPLAFDADPPGTET